VAAAGLLVTQGDWLGGEPPAAIQSPWATERRAEVDGAVYRGEEA
jgi:hypothetical protein